MKVDKIVHFNCLLVEDECSIPHPERFHQGSNLKELDEKVSTSPMRFKEEERDNLIRLG